MDKFLLTMTNIQNRLKFGEVYKLQIDAVNYTLSRKGKHYVLVQGEGQPTYFRSLEEAIPTLLNSIGKFEEKEG